MYKMYKCVFSFGKPGSNFSTLTSTNPSTEESGIEDSTLHRY